MPCVFCSSSDHVLRNCNSEIGNNIYEDVLHMMTLNVLDIKYQATILSSYTKPQLSFICMKIHASATGTKAIIIHRIISHFFSIKTSVLRLNIAQHFNMILNYIVRINLAYDYVYHWIPAPREVHLRQLLARFPQSQ